MMMTDNNDKHIDLMSSFFLPKLSKIHHVEFSEPISSIHYMDVVSLGVQRNIKSKEEEEEHPETCEDDEIKEQHQEIQHLPPIVVPLETTMVTKKYDNLKYIFRKHIPIETLYHILDTISVKNDKYYLIDFNAFRLLQFHQLYPEFAQNIIDAYKPSKQYFVTRSLTYNSFITIVRHICRVNRVLFDTKFNYQHSQYNIDYYIYHNPSS
jgi:hypothetical protein